jgi:hypothetical protein
MPSQLRIFCIQTKLIFHFESKNCISEVPLVKLIRMHKILQITARAIDFRRGPSGFIL